MKPNHFLPPLIFILITNWTGLQGQTFVSSSDESSIIRSAKIENILKYMNLSADPCDDFYKFACGNWRILNPATTENRETSVILGTQHFFYNKIASVLADNDAGDSELLQKPKKLYRSCMNVSRVKSVYRDKLLEIISEFGKMPLLEGDWWRAEDFDWLKTIAEIAYKYDTTIILGFSIDTDTKDTTEKTSVLRHFDFPLQSPAMYLNETNKRFRDEYQEQVAANLRDFLGVASNAAQQTAKDIMDLTIFLAAGANENTYAAGESYEVTTIDNLQEKYAGRLDVKKLMTISFSSVLNFKVIEGTPSYQENLVNLINRYDRRKIANFIFYYLLKPFMTFAREPSTSRQVHCAAQTRLAFHDLVENIMYHKLNVTPGETAVVNMFADLKSVFQSALISSRYRWMNKTTRSYALEKVRRMTIQIESFNDVNFTLKYANLNIGPYDFITNLKGIYAHKGVETRAKIIAPDQSYISTNLRLGPAIYHQKNSVLIPVIALLPHLLWSASYPYAINLAQLGFLVGREIVHAFDATGRKYDIHGNIREWWDSSSEAAFISRTQCFVDQYKKFTYEGQPFPQYKVHMESIADNGGIRLAYDVYMTWYSSPWHPGINVDWETLPPLPFSSQQLFFISGAQQWCHDTHPYYKNMESHIPANLRINGAFSNMEEFSGVFQCSSGSGMNSLHKCQIY